MSIEERIQIISLRLAKRINETKSIVYVLDEIAEEIIELEDKKNE